MGNWIGTMHDDSSRERTSSPRLRDSGRALTVVFAVIAIVAIGAAASFWRAQQATLARLAAARAQAERAEENFKASEGALNVLISNMADSFSSRTDIKADEMVAMLGRAETAIGTLATKTNEDPDVRRREASMYVQFSGTYLALGDSKRAVDRARKGTDIFRALAAADPNSNDLQSDVGLSLPKLAEALRAAGNNRDAVSADRESLAIARSLADKDPGNKQFRTDVVLALWRLAAIGDDPRDRFTEALKILKYLKLAALLSPAQEEWMTTIEHDLSKLR
jgi:tetratricopeptide (TPR) repeat protein